MSKQTENPLQILDQEHENVDFESRGDRLHKWIDLWMLTPARVIWQDRRARIGSLIILGYLLAGTVGVWILEPPVQNEAEPYVGAFQTLQYPLGTDGFGKDLLEQTVHATPAMLKMAFAGGVVTTVIGASVGTVAGYKGGIVERILMTAADIQMAIPGLPLLIVLAVALEPRDPLVVGFLLSVDAWAGVSRTLHSQVLALRSESYVEASRTLGLGSIPIIRDDILPNVMPYIMINFMKNTIRVIHVSVGLYFLGVLPFTTQNWGVMINLAFNRGALATLNGIHWLVVPIIAINLLAFGVTLFSQGMDRLFNPRVRARHSSVTEDGASPMGPGEE